MNRLSRILTLSAALTLGACHDLSCMEHSHCDDTILSESKSPDGKRVVTLAHRRCGGSQWTWVKVADVPPHFWSSAGDYEYLVSIPVEAPVSARWTDSTHLEIRTPALLTSEARSYPPKRRWRDVEATYPEMEPETKE